MLVGAAFGLTGTALIFRQELLVFSMNDETFRGLIYCAIAITLSSLGNITSAYNQKQKLPVVQTNAYGMLYGAGLMFLMAMVWGTPIKFDTSLPYLVSLLYLAVFGSIIAFGCYLTLIGRIGADKAAYAIVLIPVVALILSSLFEGFEITPYAFLGVVLIIGGNVLALRKK